MKVLEIATVVTLFAIAWSGGAVPASTAQPAGTGYGRCAPAGRYAVSAGEARAGRNETVVPVIIHMMMSDVPARNPHWPKDPTLVWVPSKVTEFFSRDGRVNKILAQAGVRVAVVRVDECPYSPAVVRPDHEADVSVATPLESGWESFFGEVSAQYNARDREALDVYIWVKVGIRSFASAYGTSPRRPPSAIWVDVFCALVDDPGTRVDEQKMLPETCARKLAHEVGHALTLRHLCKAPDTDTSDPDGDLPSCAQFPDSRNLMHPKPKGGRDAEYTQMTPDQKEEAVAAARAYPQQ